MRDPTNGHIGIKKNGRNQEAIVKLEKSLQSDMLDFRNSSFAYFVIINTIWFIITLVLGIYANELPTIVVGDTELEIFSISFLFIYLAIITGAASLKLFKYNFN